MLSEVQQLCDTVAFINGGVIKSIESITGGDIKQDMDTVVVVTKDIEKCEEILKNLNFVHKTHRNEDDLVVELDVDSTPELIFSLSENKIRVTEVYKKYKGLEQRYMELVEGGMRE